MIGSQDLLIGLAIMLVLFGAKRVPELARSLGQSIKEFKKGTRGAGARSPARVAETGAAGQRRGAPRQNRWIAVGATSPMAQNRTPTTPSPPAVQTSMDMPEMMAAEARTMPICRAADATSYW